ncbi:protein VACUOLELESS GAMETOPHYTES-like [Phragmites australis]|uniref:protein VACUOLELESS GAMETOPHYTES-like n=1 Tax=Phragmites australis TaxID=29695 RepID=UPI002D79C93B|nr:protein VACUOLELESS GAMETOPHYTES-like [Phragmites australis]
MCRSKSVAYFAHDPTHRLLPAGDDGDGGEFTCHGCLVAGAGRRYRCGNPGCGFTLHEVCARRFPRTLKSAVHPQHRLRRRESATETETDDHGGGGGGGGCGFCEVCGEDVKGACYGCAACGVAVHPLCARLPGAARGPAHPGGHEAWLVRASSAPPGDDSDGKQKVAAPACAACGRPVGAWRYQCVECCEELHPRCLVPATDQCRDAGAVTGEREESVAKSCCCGLLHDVTRCMATMGTALHYRGYYNG